MWVLVLHEFDLEIIDKTGARNLVVDHLSIIVRIEDLFSIQNDFPYEQLLQLHDVTLWFVNFVN